MDLAEWQTWWKRVGGAELREIFMKHWDPIGVSGAPEAQDEYDSYLGQVAHMLRTGSSPDEVARYLASVRADSMGEQHRAPDERDLNTAAASAGWYLAATRAAGETVVTDFAEIDTIHDLIHDRWFNVDDISFDRPARKVTVPFAIREVDAGVTVRKRALASKARYPAYEALLHVMNAKEYKVEDSEKGGFYDFMALDYDEGNGRLTVLTNINLGFTIEVGALELRVEPTGRLVGFQDIKTVLGVEIERPMGRADK